jgi:hypothetical protein
MCSFLAILEEIWLLEITNQAIIAQKTLLWLAA